MRNELMFSSAYDAWATPQDWFDKRNAIEKFQVDVCAAEDTAKCPIYYTKENSCLDKDWLTDEDDKLFNTTVCFMNPPYGREIGKFVKKAYEQSYRGCRVVCLLPARTDTKWFHEYCADAEIEFIEGRLTFGSDAYWEWVWEQPTLNNKPNSLYKKYGKKNPAPFPSMVVVFEN